MYWVIGDSVQVKDGTAKVVAIRQGEADLQMPDGSIKQYPYFQEEKPNPATRRHRVYHSSTPKVKKEKHVLTEQEKIDRKIARHETKIAKAKAKLQVVKGGKA